MSGSGWWPPLAEAEDNLTVVGGEKKAQQSRDKILLDFETVSFKQAKDSITRRQGDEHLAIFQLKS